MDEAPDVSIVVPVWDEGGNIVAFLEGLRDHVRRPAEILVVYDFDEDDTLPAIRAMSRPPERVRLVKNDLGRGFVNALKVGFREARGRAIVVSMADLSDDPRAVDRLAERVLGGADVVAGSRYAPGGTHAGGPFVKRTLSRLAGLSLHRLAGLPIHDVTTNFRAYSPRAVRDVEIESTGSFEVAMELTVKAWARGLVVDEVPTSWRDRTAGRTRFRLVRSLPRYLRWYALALSVPLRGRPR